MKRKSKIILALALMLVFSTVVFAARRVNMTVTYDNIKVFVDGNQVQFGKDTKGKQIEPFIYNGTTYLPLRAVGEALGKEVQWDPSTKSAFLGSGVIDNNTAQVNTEEKELVDVLEPFNRTTGAGNYVTVYYKGENKGIALKLWDDTDSHINYNLDGKYTSLSCLVGVKDARKSGYLRFIGDGRTLAEYPIESNKMADNVNVDVSGVKNLMIQLYSDEITDIHINLVNLKIK